MNTRTVLERMLYLAVPFGFLISAGLLAIACRSAWAAVGIHSGFHVASAINLALGPTADGPGMWLTAGPARHRQRGRRAAHPPQPLGRGRGAQTVRPLHLMNTQNPRRSSDSRESRGSCEKRGAGGI